MATKIDLALELKGIAYDAYSSWKSYAEGGALKITDLVANATTITTSVAGLAGYGGLARDVVAFKANEIKFSLSLTELMTEASKPNPDATIISQALLGVVSSSAGMVGAIPGIPAHIKVSANLIALGADAGKEGLGQLPQLLSTLESKIKSTGAGDWSLDPMGTNSAAILRAAEDAKSVGNAVSDLGEITITASKVIGAKITTPTDAATRVSSSFITDTSANDHLVVIKSGGTVWDAYVSQKDTATGFKDWTEFKSAVAASNPEVADLNKVAPGATLYLPEKLSDGSVTYNFAGGTSINTKGNEYHMVVPNGDGGQTVYERKADEFGYTTRQISTDKQGQVTQEYTGHQSTANADIVPISVMEQTDTNHDGKLDHAQTSWGASDGKVWGQVVESETMAGATVPTQSLLHMQQSIDKVQAANDHEQSYVLEVAALRDWVGLPTSQQVWGGVNLMRGTDANEEFIRGWETTDSVLQDYAQTVDLTGLTKSTTWGLSWNAMTSPAVTSTSSTPASWTPMDMDHTHIDRMAELMKGMDDLYAQSGYTPYSSSSSSFGGMWSGDNSWDYSHANYMPYYVDSMPSFSDPVIDFGFNYEYYAPVVLDLDGDGVELMRQEQSNAYFDVKGTGFKYHVGWVGADDGLLAIDLNGDGKIDQAKELSFALWTADPKDTDMQGLAAVFDTNHDGVLNKADTQFASFRIWQDKNGNGVTDAGELRTLADMGIDSVGLTAKDASWASGGNKISGFGTYTRTNGSQGMSADVDLGYTGSGWQESQQGSMTKLTQSSGLKYATL